MKIRITGRIRYSKDTNTIYPYPIRILVPSI